MSATTDHADLILDKRWPDALIGEERTYHGPIVGDWFGPVDWIKTTMGWEPIEDVRSVTVTMARREAAARDQIQKVLDPMHPIKRQRFIERLAHMFGVEIDQ